MIVNLHPMDMMQMAQTASEHKHIPFIFAHPGERTRVLENIDIMKKQDNVYLDISGTGILRYGVLRHLVNEVGAERILFGTDYPIGNPSAYVHGVLGEKLSDREKELILSGNAKRLLFNVHS